MGISDSQINRTGVATPSGVMGKGEAAAAWVCASGAPDRGARCIEPEEMFAGFMTDTVPRHNADTGLPRPRGSGKLPASVYL